MLRGPTSQSLSWMFWWTCQQSLRGMTQARHVFPKGMKTMRCLLTRVLPMRTTTKSQLARPTGVVARGVAIARETRTAVTVNAATGHGATAIAKDAGLMIWRGRLQRRNQSSPEPRAIRTGRHQLWMRLPEATPARVLAGAMIEPHDAQHGLRKLLGGPVWMPGGSSSTMAV